MAMQLIYDFLKGKLMKVQVWSQHLCVFEQTQFKETVSGGTSYKVYLMLGRQQNKKNKNKTKQKPHTNGKIKLESLKTTKSL